MGDIVELWIVDEATGETVLKIETRPRCPCGLSDEEHEAEGIEAVVFS